MDGAKFRLSLLTSRHYSGGRDQSSMVLPPAWISHLPGQRRRHSAGKAGI